MPSPPLHYRAPLLSNRRVSMSVERAEGATCEKQALSESPTRVLQNRPRARAALLRNASVLDIYEGSAIMTRKQPRGPSTSIRALFNFGAITMSDGATGEIRDAGADGLNCMLLSILFCHGFMKPSEAPSLAAVMRRILTLRLLLDLQFGRVIIHALSWDNPGAVDAQAAADLAAKPCIGCRGGGS